MEKISNSDKSLSGQIRNNREMIQIITIRNGRDNITTNSADIKRITGDYYEHLYAKEFDNLDEKDRLLQRPKLPKFT